MAAVKDNLRELRNISGLSQSQAAEALHVTRQTISSYETGRTEPDLEMLKKLAELYNADIKDVLYGGNRAQRNIRNLRRWGLFVSGLLVVCVLLHSLIFFANNIFFPLYDGAPYTQENIRTAEMRIALRNTADRIASAGVSVFYVGLIGLAYPLFKMRKMYSGKKIAGSALILTTALQCATLPFGLADGVYTAADYLLPAVKAFPGAAAGLLWGLALWAASLKRRD